MAQRPAASTRVLAWAEADDGFLVASPAVLSVVTGLSATGSAADGGEQPWRHVGWHEIENGGWNGETQKLTWSRYADADLEGGRHGTARLTAPGRLPEIFRERIAASIVVERFLAVSGERGVILHGRRDLAEPDPVIGWHATLGRGLSWRTPGLRETVEESLAELRLEYDPGQVP